MRRFISVLILCILHTVICCEAATKPKVTISISPLDKDHIKLEYKLPPACKSLKLFDPYPGRTQSIRQEWRAINNCGAISQNELLKPSETCTTVEFAVPIQAKVMDRVNPIAYPFYEQGVMVHTGTFSATNDCGEILWEFKSPKGGVIIDGTNRGPQVSLKQSQNDFLKYTGVFLSYKPRKIFTPLISNEKTPEWLSKGIENAAAQVTDYYQKTYPKLTFLPPALFVVNTIDPNSEGFQADVSSPRMIRFGYFNYNDTPAEDVLKNAMGATAHEFSHILQPSAEVPPYINEGGSEFIRWITENKLHWRDNTYSATEFSNAVSACLLAAGGKTWAQLETENLKGGPDVYSCGLAVNVLALASRQNKDSAEETVHLFYQKWKQNKNFDFAQSIECGSLNECQPQFFEKLQKGDKSFATVFDEQLAQLGLIKSKTVAQNAAARQAFATLMTEDCGGTGFWTKTDHFLTDGIPPTCKTFTNGLAISKVNDVSYFEKPLDAVAAQNTGCQTNHFVYLTTIDLQKIKVACTREYKSTNIVYEVDADRLLSLMDSH